MPDKILKNYIEHSGKMIDSGERFKHVMAITLNPLAGYKEGIIRVITSRQGDVAVKGFLDRSELYRIHGDLRDRFEIGEKLKFKNQIEIIKALGGKDKDFIGFEDPDIWIDEKNNLTHVYFTMPFRDKVINKTFINLGHAVGENLDSLEMTMPVLQENKTDLDGGAKEVSIAPLNRQGFRYNLIESSSERNDVSYSIVNIAIAQDMGKPWEFGQTAFHPAEHNIPWVGGHASPGPLLSSTFINVGEGKLAGILNGREANRKIGKIIKYGMFSVGLFIYDYENGKIDWVSPEPLIQDSEAKTITFASQFVETGPGAGILYAHVDDSFVRAYSLFAEKIKALLP